jgi:hypothetical protein
MPAPQGYAPALSADLKTVLPLSNENLMKSTESAIERALARHGNKPSFYKEIGSVLENSLVGDINSSPMQVENMLRHVEKILSNKKLSRGYFRQQVQKSPKLSGIIDDEADAIYRSEYND